MSASQVDPGGVKNRRFCLLRWQGRALKGTEECFDVSGGGISGLHTVTMTLWGLSPSEWGFCHIVLLS